MNIFITTKFVGLHRWKGAPECVVYLRDAHRHNFGVKVTVPVTDPERQIEFITFKKFVDDTIVVLQMHPEVIEWSCETWGLHIIASIISSLDIKDPGKITCTVDEDGECGATVTGWEAKKMLKDAAAKRRTEQ